MKGMEPISKDQPPRNRRALEGTLRDFSILDVFQLIGIQQKSGVLTVKTVEDTVSIGFQEGLLVCADSQNSPKEMQLRRILVSSGRLTQQELDEALKANTDATTSLTSSLLKREICSQEDLAASLNLQLKRTLYNLFRFKEGEFIFDTDAPVVYEKDIARPIEVNYLMMEAVQMTDEWPILEKVIPSTAMVFDQAPASEKVVIKEGSQNAVQIVLPDQTSPVCIVGKEALVYQAVNGQRKVEDIINLTVLPDFDCYKALYSLTEKGLIKESNGTVAHFEIVSNFPSLDEFINKLRESLAPRCHEIVQLLPSRVVSRAIIFGVKISTRYMIWLGERLNGDEWLDCALGLADQASQICGMKRAGVFEYVIDESGVAVFWDYDADFMLVVADIFFEHMAASRFRSGIGNATRVFLPSK